MKASDKIKVVIPTPAGPSHEKLWAQPVGVHAAIVASIPLLTDQVGLDDLVELDSNGSRTVTQVMRRGSATILAIYAPSDDPEDWAAEWRQIVGHFEPHGIVCESATPGVFGMSVPTLMSNETVDALLAACPIAIERDTPSPERTLLVRLLIESRRDDRRQPSDREKYLANAAFPNRAVIQTSMSGPARGSVREAGRGVR